MKLQICKYRKYKKGYAAMTGNIRTEEMITGVEDEGEIRTEEMITGVEDEGQIRTEEMIIGVEDEGEIRTGDDHMCRGRGRD